MPDKRAARNVRRIKDRRAIARYEADVLHRHLTYRDDMAQFIRTPPNFFDMLMGVTRPMPRFPDLPPMPAIKGYTGMNSARVDRVVRNLRSL